MNERVWQLVALGAATAAGALARGTVRAVWRTASGGEPPENPAARGVSWPDAIAWSAGVGVAAGVFQVVARRLAAEGWERATGDPPPGLEPA